MAYYIVERLFEASAITIAVMLAGYAFNIRVLKENNSHPPRYVTGLSVASLVLTVVTCLSSLWYMIIDGIYTLLRIYVPLENVYTFTITLCAMYSVALIFMTVAFLKLVSQTD